MSDDRSLCKVAELCDSIDYGFTASASKLSVGPKFLRITDIVSGEIDWNSVPYVAASDSIAAKFRLYDGDIVIARTGASTGASTFVSRPPSSIFASYLVRLKISENACARYVAYALRSSYYWHFIHGVLGEKSAQPNASARTLTQAQIPVPPLPEQHAIAHILGTLDDKIELNRQMNATLDAIARTLFTSWFVNFDPVRAKAEGRQPEGMDAETAALFPDRFVDSELGPIPEGWEVGTLGVIAALSRTTVKPNQHLDEIFDHYSLPSFDQGQIPVREPGSRINSNKTLVVPNSVLISKLNPHIPRVWLPQLRNDARSICSTEFLVLTSKAGSNREFLFSHLTSSKFDGEFRSRVTGTTGSHQRVSTDSLTSIGISLPPTELVDRFYRVVAPMFELIGRNRTQSMALAETRDALLPELLSGRVRVGEAEPANAGRLLRSLGC